MIILKSQKSFADARQSILDALKEKELKLFAEFDHQKNAQEAGMTLSPISVLVFGNAAVGTHLMQDVPASAVHLPLKITLLELDNGTEIRYESPEDWKTAYPFSDKSKDILDKMTLLMAGLTEAAR